MPQNAPDVKTQDERRKRTRKTIVEATMALIARGENPSINEIADAAGVSRRTVYMHFPTLEQLLLDATLGSLAQSAVDMALDEAAGDDAQARIETLVREFMRMSEETLPLGRRLIRLTVDAPNPHRGARRVEWIERALEPLRKRLTPARFERLVSALAMVLGWEGLIVLQDVRGLRKAEQQRVTLWAAQALIQAALNEPA